MKKKGIALTILGGVITLFSLGWFGLRARPKPMKLADQPQNKFEFADLPQDLPQPVRRHYELAFGNHAPMADTAVFLGRAQFRMGLWMQMRFAAYHLLGRNLLRNIEVTWFDQPFLKGEDTFINGKGMMNINGEITDGFEIDQAACVNMWCEAIMFPLAGNGRIRWEAIDEHTARLYMPFADGEEEATVHFDPVSGFMRHFTTLRYKDKGSGKIPWHVEYLNWTTYTAGKFPQKVTVMWEDEGSPWFIGEIDDVVLNVTVPEKMQVQQTTWEDVLRDTAVPEPEI